MNQQTVDDLIAAKALIATPERWTKGAYARDAEGEATGLTYEKAVCFCLSGAIDRACNYESARWLEAVNYFTLTTTHKTTQFNDAPSTTHEMIIQALDLTIEAAKRAAKAKGLNE